MYWLVVTRALSTAGSGIKPATARRYAKRTRETFGCDGKEPSKLTQREIDCIMGVEVRTVRRIQTEALGTLRITFGGSASGRSAAWGSAPNTNRRGDDHALHRLTDCSGPSWRSCGQVGEKRYDLFSRERSPSGRRGGFASTGVR